ncbi:sulfatase [Lutibacter citreus]|uniref:sulfatase n=1 Tax=Lutibacter citreus TaxID=2138210 RepID=UPI0015D0B6AC|nr:sulfatase [Lutibacter citreus]
MNVLFIAIDDLNSCIDGMDGEISVSTPNINKLTKEGVLFTNAHCAAPACNPSRVSVMTGLAPTTTGVYTNQQDWRENKFLKKRTTLPQHFKNNGYETLGGGKLYHASSLSADKHTGLIDAKPWDSYFPSKMRQMPLEVKPDKFPVNTNGKMYNGYFDWAKLDIPTEEMADAKVVSWAEQQLSKSHDKPLFLAVGIYRPHIPWWTPKKYYDMHPIDKVELPEIVENDLGDLPLAGKKMANTAWHKWIKDNNKWKEAVQAYSASVSFADDMVGRLLKALNNGPLAKNTVIILWSDHGYHLGQKEHWEKFALWEQTTRVPLILAAPGKFKKGEKSCEAVSLLDIYPTLNELCGIPLNDNLDGESLVPLLKKPTLKTNRSIVTTQRKNNHAVRSDNWRYIRYQDGSEELYNQKKDPKNFVNLAGQIQYKKIIEKMKESLPKTEANSDPLKSYKKH